MAERKKLLTPRAWPIKPKPVPRPKGRRLKGMAAIVFMNKGPRPTYEAIRKAPLVFQRMQGRKAAQHMQETGQAHVWTTETARKAAFKRWRHTWLNTKTGKRFVPLVKHMPLPRKELRITYAHVIQNGVTYREDTQSWVRRFKDGTWHPISERAALVRLGFKANPHGFVADRAFIFTNPVFFRRKGENLAQWKIRTTAWKLARKTQGTSVVVPPLITKDKAP